MDNQNGTSETKNDQDKKTMIQELGKLLVKTNKERKDLRNIVRLMVEAAHAKG